jgi:hypothetical protein
MDRAAVPREAWLPGQLHLKIHPVQTQNNPMASKQRFLVRILLPVSLLLGLSGCIASIGNRPPPVSAATIGQQLIDLKKALDSGVITQAEYEQQRKKLLNEKQP